MEEMITSKIKVTLFDKVAEDILQIPSSVVEGIKRSNFSR